MSERPRRRGLRFDCFGGIETAEVPGFRLEASTLAEDFHRVRLTGEIDFTCAEALAQGLIYFNGTSIEIDVSDVTFIDAATVGALVGVREKLRKQSCELYVTGARGIVRKVLGAVGPADWVPA